MPWTFNASAPKKNLTDALDNEYKKYDGVNHYDGQMDLVKPVVKAILDSFKITDENRIVDVTVSEGEMGGNTSVNINVVIH